MVLTAWGETCSIHFYTFFFFFPREKILLKKRDQKIFRVILESLKIPEPGNARQKFSTRSGPCWLMKFPMGSPSRAARTPFSQLNVPQGYVSRAFSKCFFFFYAH